MKVADYIKKRMFEEGRKFGLQKQYITSVQGNQIVAMEVKEVLEDGIVNSLGVVFKFDQLLPNFPLNDDLAMQLHSKESGVITPNGKLIVPG